MSVIKRTTENARAVQSKLGALPRPIPEAGRINLRSHVIIEEAGPDGKSGPLMLTVKVKGELYTSLPDIPSLSTAIR